MSEQESAYKRALDEWRERGRLISNPGGEPCIRGDEADNFSHDFYESTGARGARCRRCGALVWP